MQYGTHCVTVSTATVHHLAVFVSPGKLQVVCEDICLLLPSFQQDFAWLELVNESRIKDGMDAISEDVFELAMDRFEKESVFECKLSGGSGGEDTRMSVVDEDAQCSVCGSGDTDADNNIIFCDLCNIAVHQVFVSVSCN